MVNFLDENVRLERIVLSSGERQSVSCCNHFLLRVNVACKRASRSAAGKKATAAANGVRSTAAAASNAGCTSKRLTLTLLVNFVLLRKLNRMVCQSLHLRNQQH